MLRAAFAALIVCAICTGAAGAASDAAWYAGLDAYVGKYPSDRISGGVSFRANPKLRTALRAALTPRYLRLYDAWLTEAKIERIGSSIYSFVCHPHQCGDQLHVFVDTADGTVRACLELGARDVWFHSARPPRRLPPGSCGKPEPAGMIAAYDTPKA